MSPKYHIPVRLNEVLEGFDIKKNQIYCDCTFGFGGHSLEILKKLENTGLLIAFDQDEFAYKNYLKNYKNIKNLVFIKDNFINLSTHLKSLNIDKVDGFLFDFGVSSYMLDEAERGFSYKLDARLDMRMDQTKKLDAYQIINQWSEKSLNQIFKEYGEVKNPYLVTKNIIEKRKIKPVTSTLELVELIREKTSKKDQFAKKHFARQYFQAIRIAVNDELNCIKKGLENAIGFLNKNGKIITISFHSLEEKMIKKTYSKYLNSSIPSEVPLNNEIGYRIIRKVDKKTSSEEISDNNRSRSAFLKIFVKK